MRQFYSISLAGLFIVNTITGILVLCLHHFRMESIIHTNHDSGIDIQLKLTDDELSDLIWFKKGREFSYRGHMYDVIRSERNNDGTTIYHCISDEKESELHRNIIDDHNPLLPGQQHHRTLVIQLFKFLSNILIDPPAGTFTYESEILTSRFNYMDKVHPGYSSVICEPPDFI